MRWRYTAPSPLLWHCYRWNSEPSIRCTQETRFIHAHHVPKYLHPQLFSCYLTRFLFCKGFSRFWYRNPPLSGGSCEWFKNGHGFKELSQKPMLFWILAEGKVSQIYTQRYTPPFWSDIPESSLPAKTVDHSVSPKMIFTLLCGFTVLYCYCRSISLDIPQFNQYNTSTVFNAKHHASFLYKVKASFSGKQRSVVQVGVVQITQPSLREILGVCNVVNV